MQQQILLTSCLLQILVYVQSVGMHHLSSISQADIASLTYWPRFFTHTHTHTLDWTVTIGLSMNFVPRPTL